ncbi:MAG TPA: replicative DNA helicase [Hydrogenophaga sp.]|mgnify:CR=1 FL=1|uniref:replicative DNA helicase n=1 Tax=Hydrogenophaga sp. TaxID=1904254 RepID=UPI002C4F3761|nr:replicative DNA helicase [Hydrogenophaga sp.]HMN92223.1 replicative DNA helicase [Hydrogenophaga sp.]HMP11575.1 replicative DNA helicase [Hydrogenophaga sp.]
MHDGIISDDLALPPHSIEAESSVLGGLLLDNGAWDRVSDLLAESDFYRYEHRLVFGAVAALINASKPADVVTVFEHLRALGKGVEAVDLQFLNGLAQYVPSAANIRRYAEIVRERATQRRLLTACAQAREIAAEVLDVHTACNEIQQLFEPIAQQTSPREPVALAELLPGMLDRVSDLAEGRQQPGISTGFPKLDHYLGGGLRPGKLVVIAARPSIGKSSLAASVGIAAAEAGEPVGIFSLEMPAEELTDRLVARIGRIDLGRLTTGTLLDNEWSRLTDAAEVMRDLPLYIDDQAGLGLHEIRSKARKLKRKHGIRVLVVDYLQLCGASTQRANSNRHLQLEEISRGLKAMSKQLGLTVILLSQLNREVEKRTGGRPQLSDLKESGAIEEDADVVILLSKDGDMPDGASLIHAELAKNRGGKRGVFVKVAFNGAQQIWTETTAQALPAQPTKRTQRHFVEDYE